MKPKPAELPFLLREIEHQSGIDPSCPESFDELCDHVIAQIEALPVPKGCPRHTISKKTLRRTWGKIKDGYGASPNTLHLLARIAGYRGWNDFRSCIAQKIETENPLAAKTIAASALTPGNLYLLGNPPFHYMYAQYLGNGTFKAIATFNSKIRDGETFRAASLYVYPRLDPSPDPLPELRDNPWWTSADNDNA